MAWRASGEGEEVTDEALLSAIALGDEGAGVAFVRRYQRRVFGLALAILSDAKSAEDVAQEALIRVWRHAQVFDPRRGSVTSWVLTITRNLALDQLRLRGSDPTDPHDLVFLNLAAMDRAPEDVAVSRLDQASLRAALVELPAEQRRAIVLASIYGRTTAEIATSEGLPLGTVKGRIRLGMTKLRQQLVVEGAG